MTLSGELGFEMEDEAAAARGGVLTRVGGAGHFESVLGILVPLSQHSLHVLRYDGFLIAGAHLSNKGVEWQCAITGNQ